MPERTPIRRLMGRVRGRKEREIFQIRVRNSPAPIPLMTRI